MTVGPVGYPSPVEFVARAIAFGLLVIASIAAIVLSGAWWAACVAAAGLLLAIAGLVVSILALLSDEQALSWRASRSTELALGVLSIVAIMAALIAG